MERIICAAIWYHELPAPKMPPKNVDKGIVICGWRHGNVIDTLFSLTGKRSVQPEVGKITQGFLTNKNRFVDRKEGAKIAKEAGQLSSEIVEVETLYSEDLY